MAYDSNSDGENLSVSKPKGVIATFFSRVARWFGMGKSEVSEMPDAAPPAPQLLTLSAAIPSLADAPPVTKPLSQDKRTAFKKYLHRVYTPGQDVEAFCKEQQQICDAYIVSLDPKGAFAEALASTHGEALTQLYASDAFGDLPKQNLVQTSKTSIQSIVLNRRDDMAASRRLLDDPAFRAELAQTLATPSGPKKLAPALTQNKREELIDTLVQPNALGGHEPSVHIYANAKGQILEHRALSLAFAKDGKGERALATALAANLPPALKSRAGALAGDYIEDRRHAADLIVAALKLDGELLAEAVQRSERLRNAAEISHTKKLLTRPAQAAGKSPA